MLRQGSIIMMLDSMTRSLEDSLALIVSFHDRLIHKVLTAIVTVETILLSMLILPDMKLEIMIMVWGIVLIQKTRVMIQAVLGVQEEEVKSDGRETVIYQQVIRVLTTH